ncbi:MAG: hypothetical protein AAFU79_10550 [Myxococcota bacterium]
MTEPHLSAIEVELASVGELDPERQLHLQSCKLCQFEVEQLMRGAEAFLDAQPFEAFALGAVKDALPPEPLRPVRWTRRAALGSGVMACAAAVALFVGTSSPPELRLKGGSSFSAILARGSTQSEHVGEVRIRAGDRLRFSVVLGEEATVRLELNEGEDAPLQLFDGGRMSPGQYFVPEAALRAEPPLIESRVRFYLDGTLADELYIRVEEDE